MKEYRSSVNSKGQITVPMEVRRRWGLRPKDRVVIHVEEEMVTITPARSPVDEMYGALPRLARPMTVEEMTTLAAEEHAHEAANEGR